MKFFRKKLDERQEIESLRVASIAYLIAFWGLAAAIIIQRFVFNLDFAHLAGELIILAVMSVYASIGYYRRGIWDTLTKPGIKAYLVYSFLGVLLSNIPTIANCIKYQTSIPEFLTYFIMNSVIAFPIAFALIAGLGMFIKRRQKKLAEKYMDEN